MFQAAVTAGGFGSDTPVHICTNYLSEGNFGPSWFRRERLGGFEKFSVQRISPQACGFAFAGFAEMHAVRGVFLCERIVVGSGKAVRVLADDALLHAADLAEAVGRRLAVHDHGEIGKSRVAPRLFDPA